jgi:hypothetical protein
LALWLTIQLAVLIVSAARVPLWARFERPGEDLALDVMFITQICAAALSAPIVAGTWRRAAATILTSALSLQLAAMLAAADIAHTALAAAYVACWLFSLTLWIRALRCSRTGEALVVAIGSVLTIGGIVLLYAQREFTDAAHRASLLSPIVVAPPQLHRWSNWIFLTSLLITGIVALIITRRLGSRATSYPHESSTDCG